MACSALIESGLWFRDAVERQMSHQERNGVRAAYIHKAEHLEERRLMLQWWQIFWMRTERKRSVRLNMQNKQSTENVNELSFTYTPFPRRKGVSSVAFILPQTLFQYQDCQPEENNTQSRLKRIYTR